MTVITTKTASHLIIAAPYNAEFVSGIKGMLGKWDANARKWIVPLGVEAEALALLRGVYGEDGSPVVRVNLEIEFLHECESRGAISLGGVEVVYARGRDSGGHPSAGVAKLSGELTSSGSRTNYTVVAHKGLRLRMLEVPLPLAHRIIAADNDTTSKIWIEGAAETGDNVVKLHG